MPGRLVQYFAVVPPKPAAIGDSATAGSSKSSQTLPRWGVYKRGLSTRLGT